MDVVKWTKRLLSTLLLPFPVPSPRKGPRLLVRLVQDAVLHLGSVSSIPVVINKTFSLSHQSTPAPSTAPHAYGRECPTPVNAVAACGSLHRHTGSGAGSR